MKFSLFNSWHEIFEIGNEMNVVIDYAKGGHLFDRIVQKSRYAEDEARGLIKNLLIALDYMSEMGVVHRNLKPESILMCSG